MRREPRWKNENDNELSDTETGNLSLLGLLAVSQMSGHEPNTCLCVAFLPFANVASYSQREHLSKPRPDFTLRVRKIPRSWATEVPKPQNETVQSG